MYQAMIQAMCRKGDLEESIQRLRELSALGQYPDKQILSAVTTAHALAGKMKGARQFYLPE
jgi:pentatricopeptide repeat protein